jgi:hypothetical protein
VGTLGADTLSAVPGGGVGGEMEERERERERERDDERRKKAVSSRVSMFETGDMAAPLSRDDSSSQESSPSGGGRGGSLPPLKAHMLTAHTHASTIDTNPVDVGNIKERWSSGGYSAAASEGTCNESASTKEAMFRIHSAINVRGGGVGELASKIQNRVDGVAPEAPEVISLPIPDLL